MIKMKNIISFLVSLVIIIVVILNLDIIIDTIKNIEFLDREIVLKDANQWEKDYEFMYFKETPDYEPNNYDELVEVFYTVLDKGWDSFTFYCGDEYEDCLEDVAILSNDEKFLSEINNFVHPFNSYTTIRTLYDDTGEITIKIDKLYSDEEIILLDRDIDRLMKDTIEDSMTLREKIKAMHDVIINNTKYDEERADTGDSQYDSARIHGVLYDNYAICSGYTDTMAVILTKLGVPNFKIASEEHVWNAVYIDNEWYHLDLTWDDPISTSGRNLLLHDYFLISDDDLTKLDTKNKKVDHIYSRDIYQEFN